MHFLNTIRSTFYDPAFYRGLRTYTIEHAVKFFLKLGVIGITATLIFGFAGMVPFIGSGFLDKIIAQYPDDLVMEIARGELTVNKPEPYYVKNTIEPAIGENIVIFDGGDTLKGDLKALSTIALVKRNFIIVGSDDQQRVIPLSSTSTATTTITKADVVKFIDEFRPYFIPAIVAFVVIMVVFFVIFGTLFWVIFHMLYTLIPALAVFALMKFRSEPLSWYESYLTALYATVPTAIISFALTLAGIHAPFLAYTLAVLIIVLANTWNKQPPALESGQE